MAYTPSKGGHNEMLCDRCFSLCVQRERTGRRLVHNQRRRKKLAGAALTSFMTKCEQDAAAACDANGKSKKLAGAALDSHMKKCIADAVGDK
jgi:hypothetical protein